jgi:hypothetical protein
MRKVFAVLAVLLTAACASMKSDSGLGNAKVDVARPDIRIMQLSSVPAAARHVEGNLPVHYKMRVSNRSAEPITLKQVSVQSMGYGAYIVDTTSRPFKTRIEPDQFQEVEFWVPARVDEASIVGANGPVTLRATLQFDSPVGQFQQIVVQQVNAMPGRDTQDD